MLSVIKLEKLDGVDPGKQAQTTSEQSVNRVWKLNLDPSAVRSMKWKLFTAMERRFMRAIVELERAKTWENAWQRENQQNRG